MMNNDYPFFEDNNNDSYNNGQKGKRLFPKIVIGVVSLIALIIFFNSVVIVHQNEFAMLKTMGKIETVYDTPGLKFKNPFIQSVTYISGRIQLYDMKPSDVITKDKKSMILDNFVLWKIDDALKFYQSLGNVSAGEGRIDTIVYNSLKNYVSANDQMDVIVAKDENFDSKILEQINESLSDYGISVKSVGIKRFDLPDDNKDAVYTRMVSERDQIAASYSAEGKENAQKIINDADKQAAVIVSEGEAKAAEIIAQGESEYMKILAEAYGTPERKDFYEFLRALDAMEVSIQGDNKTLVLPIDSPIAKLFKGY